MSCNGYWHQSQDFIRVLCEFESWLCHFYTGYIRGKLIIFFVLFFPHLENGDNNSISLSGQGSFMVREPVTLHMVWDSECGPALGVYCSVVTSWHFSQLLLSFVVKLDGTMRQALRAWSLGSLWSHLLLPPSSLEGIWSAPFPASSASLCFQCGLGWGLGSQISQWCTCSVSGTGEAWAPVKIFHSANMSW